MLPLLRLISLTLQVDIHEMGGIGNSYFVAFMYVKLVLEPLFRVLVYVSGTARNVYGPMVSLAKKANLPIDLIAWDEKLGSRETSGNIE